MTRYIQVGGAVDPRDHVYIQRTYRGDDGTRRDLEDELLQRVRERRDCAIVGPRHVGKSSLATYVFHELRDSGWTVAWVDLDDIPENSEDVTGDFLRIIGPQLDSRSRSGREGETLIEGVSDLLSENNGPVLLVIDELDNVLASQHRPPAASFLRSLRALQQARARIEALSQVVLCTMSLRMVEQMFDATEVYGRPEAAVAPVLEVLPVGLFPANDRTRRSLEECFEEHDPEGKGNLARWILEQSGGQPQLCMALARRLIQTGTQYSSVDSLERFFVRQVGWFRQRPDSEGRMLEISADILASFGPDAELLALGVYANALDAAGQRREGAEHPKYVFRDKSSTAQLHLLLAGLLYEDIENDVSDSGDPILRPAGPFMERYFGPDWIRGRRDHAVAAKASLTAVRVDKPGRPTVCILITGGTIGMVEKEGRVVPPPPNDPDALAREYAVVEERFNLRWVKMSENLDSVDVGPSEWSTYSEEIYRLLATDVAGIVVAHGTDTLAFTASAVAYALGRNLTKPVVFTGSQTTVDQHHGDARQNLLRACMVATQQGLPEVVIMFGEYVFRATRAIKRDDRRFDAFESLLYPPLATVSEALVLQSEVIRSPELRPPGEPPAPVRPRFVDGITVISQIPGLRTEFFRRALLDPECQPSGLIIQSLGAGNVPTRGPYDLDPVIRLATEELGIPVLLTSQYPIHPGNLGRYLPSRRAIDDGAIPIANVTLPALVAKLSWVLGQFGTNLSREEVRDQMLFDYVGELGARDADAFKAAMEQPHHGDEGDVTA